MPDSDDLATIARALLAALAPGPWSALPEHEVYGHPGEHDGPHLWKWAVVETGEDDPPLITTEFAGQETAEFIAASRTLVPALCDEIERLRAEVAGAEQRGRQDALREAADEIQALHPGEVKASVEFLRAKAGIRWEFVSCCKTDAEHEQHLAVRGAVPVTTPAKGITYGEVRDMTRAIKKGQIYGEVR